MTKFVLVFAIGYVTCFIAANDITKPPLSIRPSVSDYISWTIKVVSLNYHRMCISFAATTTKRQRPRTKAVFLAQFFSFIGPQNLLYCGTKPFVSSDSHLHGFYCCLGGNVWPYIDIYYKLLSFLGWSWSCPTCVSTTSA